MMAHLLVQCPAMQPLHRLVCSLTVAAIVLGSAACGGDDGPDAAGSTAAPTTTAPTAVAPTTAPAATTAPSTVAATTAPTTAGPTTTVDDGVIDISVTVGVDDATTTGSRVERIPLGAAVRLTIVSDMDEEYHLHEPYDVEQRVAAGVPWVFEFTADQSGSVKVESHLTNDLLVLLEIA
jgi:hypothetical protein